MKIDGINRGVVCGLACWTAGLLPMDAGGAERAGERVWVADDFKNGLVKWVVEQQPGGTVEARNGVLVIDDKAGCTVWLREPLRAPVRIRYLVTVRGGTRDGEKRGPSDLNCFWMATDPRGGGEGAAGFFAAEKTGRDGTFASYDGLKTYYVGYGGNHNTTTRFRRYDGAGARPLQPEHDLGGAERMLEEGREYRIEIVVTEEGRTTWARDGEVLFDHLDPEPLREGWFGLRTVWARLEVRDFVVERL